MATAYAVRPSSLQAVIASAARRRLFVLIVERLPFALSVVLAGVLLVLVVGTSWVAPVWLLAFALVGLGMITFQVRGRRRNRYRIAQMLDQRLRLNDSLSTAWFLLSGTGPTTDNGEYQIRLAEQLAGTVRPESAFPLKMGRSWAVPGLLLFLILGLVGLRLRTQTFDLHHSLVPLRLPESAKPSDGQASERRSGDAARKTTNAARQRIPEIPIGEKNPQGGPIQSSSNNMPAGSVAQSEPQQQNPANASELSAASPKEAPDSPGALSRMKDALNGMMAKLGQNLKSADAKAQKDSRDGQDQSEKQDQKGSPKQSKGQQAKSDAQNEKQNDDAANGSTEQAKAVEKNLPSQRGNSKQGSEEHGSDSQSGAGRNDGNKDLRDAEQLKAAGKLEEIIGKRSAALTGEMTIEKSSGTQQLRTQYSNQGSVHSDRGGDINRDEIPPEYRDYIRTYMNEVHKQRSSGKSTTPAPQ